MASAAASRTVQSPSERPRTIAPTTVSLAENEIALTAARRTRASGSLAAAIRASSDSSSFRKPTAPTACTRTSTSASARARSAGCKVALLRNSRRARNADSADEGLIMRDERQQRRGSVRILQFCCAVGGGRCYAQVSIEKRHGQRRRGMRTVEFAERQGRLLAHAGVGVGQCIGQELRSPAGRRCRRVP